MIKKSISIILCFVFAATAQAQMGPPMKPGEVKTSFETIFIYQGSAGLDSGGDVQVDRFAVEGGFTWGLEGGHALGFDIGYGLADYAFSDVGIATPLGSTNPWGKIQTFEFDVAYRHILDRRQSLFFLPSFQFSKESGADWGGSLRWGGIAGYVRQFSPELALGFGGAFFGGLEDNTGFPVIFVYWQFAENWRLANPFRPGPSGPAGLEVVYDGLDQWEIGFGGGWRNQRFLLDDNSPVPEGYGENRGVPLFVRATYMVNDKMTLDFYGGGIVAGELRLDDADGSRLAEESYGTALVGAISLTIDL